MSRLLRSLSAVALVASVASCKAKSAKNQTQAGDALVLKLKAGDTHTAQLRLLIEQDIVSERGQARRVVLEFEGVDEQAVSSMTEDGAALVTARLADITGRATSGADQRSIDQFALALDELKIQFKRTPRAETANLSIIGVRPPLDDRTARSVVQQVYSAGRGPILPDKPVEVGGTWRVETPLAMTLGFEGLVSYEYTYAKRDGQIAIISSEGKVDGRSTSGAPKTLQGSSSAEFRVDVALGRVVAATIDATTTVQEGAASRVKQRIRVSWQIKEKA